MMPENGSIGPCGASMPRPGSQFMTVRAGPCYCFSVRKLVFVIEGGYENG